MSSEKYNTDRVKRTCEDKLGIQFRKRGAPHNVGWFKFNNRKTVRVVLAKGRKKIKKGTFDSIVNSLRLTHEEFDDLMKCPLGLAEYIEILRERRLIEED
jgi:hypothetical protein